MSTMTFDAAGVTGLREVPRVKQAAVRPQAPRLTPMQDAPAAPALASRARTFFGRDSAVSYECGSWMRWTGV